MLQRSPGVHDTAKFPPPCPRIHDTVPLGVLFLALALTVAWLIYVTSESDVAESARSTGLFIQWCGMTSYSIVILDAYQLAKTLHHDAAFSGQLIGLYMAATAVGGLITSSMLWYYPDVWKMYGRLVLLLGQAFNITGFCTYAWITSYVSYNVINTPGEHETLSAALLFARVNSGIGHGIGATLLQVSFAHLTPVQDRPAQMTRFMFVNTLGIGLGPMIAAGMRMMEFCPLGQPPGFELVGLAQIVLSGASLISVLVFYPNLKDFASTVEADDCRAAEQSPRSGILQRLIVIGCMLSTLVRAMVTSGVEGATSLLLEISYGFPRHVIGIIIGATFLACFPVKLAMDSRRSRLTVYHWIRGLCGISVIGALLLFRRDWAWLITADVLLFPSLYLGDGMLRGVMQQFALPTGSILDQTGTTLIAMILNSVGRFLGPWVARLLLEDVNQTGYAALQVFLAILFWVVFELMIVRPVKALPEQTGEVPPEETGNEEIVKQVKTLDAETQYSAR
jgi:hypothetical protein